MRRLLVGSSALFWGLQFAFLNPVLALLLVALYRATPAEVGWVLAVFNTSGFIASLVLPAYADRKREYLRPMLLCGVLTLVLAGVLAFTTALPVAVLALVVLGGPAGVGSSLLFAHLKASGARVSDVMNTRAVVSFAWVAGPPLATIIMGAFGNRSILPVLVVVAAFNIATTILMSRQRSAPDAPSAAVASADDGARVGRTVVVAVVVGFVLLQATNSAAVSIMSLFVTQRLHLPLIWSGVALGVSALLEIPALLIIGRLSLRFSSLPLIITGCLAGIAYYAGMAVAADPVTLVLLQVPNAWFFGIVAGIGLTLFQQIIPRPGLASGLFTNTRRIGAIISGPIISIGAASPTGYQGIFFVCAALTLAALLVIALAQRLSAEPTAPA
ncbi:MFS transporter [Microbacterium sp. 22242]|uniref:MFS transporter n=1 Tax=Microbacterium sp. 22242 TaxID=3453896 RepID=UPI003F82C7CF